MNNNFSKYAFKSENATYINPINLDFRGTFYHDIDKIIYSLAFVRYMDKTQVFSYNDHSHLTKRMLHVLFVSKISRTISRALGLNEDLAEAIALGHDLGHVPFGHAGEKILNELSLEKNAGYFNHNIHSVRLLKDIENYGNGLNISMQVLDGIMCHNGEFEVQKLVPRKKNIQEFLDEYNNTYIDKDCMSSYVACTLEGCIVRISDIIAYLGRDIEDAIRLKLIKKEDIPESITNVLGDNTSSIVNTIINDIIKNSLNKPYIEMSNSIFTAIKDLKKFNYENIYNKSTSKEDLELYKDMFYKLFDKYLDDINNNNEESPIICSYLKNMSDNYKKNNSKERIIIDYLAGMTNDYIKMQYSKLL